MSTVGGHFINKTLAKNVSERYETSSELLTDLKTLQKRLEFKAELKRTSSSGDAPETTTQVMKAAATGKTKNPNSIAIMRSPKLAQTRKINISARG